MEGAAGVASGHNGVKEAVTPAPAAAGKNNNNEGSLGEKDFPDEGRILPIQQQASDTSLTCSGLDTGIRIEDFITNEENAVPKASEQVTEAAAKAAEDKPDAGGNKAAAEAPMGQNSIEVEAVTITTTAGENEAVVGPVVTTTAAPSLQTSNVSGDGDENTDNVKNSPSKSCVVNMASLDEDKSGKKKDDQASSAAAAAAAPAAAAPAAAAPAAAAPASAAPAAAQPSKPAKTNGSSRARKSAEKTNELPAKRGRRSKSAEKNKQAAEQQQQQQQLASQPFTEAQQLQLRAQILVYGAIMNKQCSLPDENLMAASFVDTSKVRTKEAFESHYTSSRKVWEKTWKATSERMVKATGEPPALVTFSGLPSPPPAQTRPPGLPRSPRGKSSKTATTTTTVQWQPSGSAARPPRFPTPVPAAAATPPPAVRPWGVPWAPPHTFGPAFVQVPYAIQSPVPQGDANEPTSKRRKTDTLELAIQGNPEDFVSQVEMAKRTAEDAAASSASIVQQTHLVWDSVREKLRAKSVTAKEAQLASCMAAISAASSVAKAASAAANVAYAAALQAKQMVVEASASVEPSKEPGNSEEEQVVAAKVAAREQVEIGLASARRAGNLEAIVRAAELASEAAKHAGTLMSIGDGLPLATPEDNSNEKELKSKGKRGSSRSKLASSRRKAGAEEKGAEEKSADGKSRSREATPVLKEAQQQQQTQPQLDGQVVEHRQPQKPAEIKEGSQIEIWPDEEGLQGVWFSAVVLEIKGDEALVKYDDLLNEDFSGDESQTLEEWVNLASHQDNIPRIRLKDADGGRRKRRAAAGSKTWLPGDHVDVWMRDGWWEGVVQSATEEDNLVTVYFPSDGDTEVTKSHNLRPSLMWHEGAWVPWRNVGQKLESTTPPESGKRKDLEAAKPRSGAKPTKRKKFSEVLEQEAATRDEKMKTLQSLEDAKQPLAASRRKVSPEVRKSSRYHSQVASKFATP